MGGGCSGCKRGDSRHRSWDIDLSRPRPRMSAWAEKGPTTAKADEEKRLDCEKALGHGPDRSVNLKQSPSILDEND